MLSDPMAACIVSARLRHTRAEWKAALKSGCLSPDEALDALDDPAFAQMRVAAFVAAFPGVGDARVNRILVGLRIGPRTRIGDLTLRQRYAVADALAGRR